MYVCKFVLLACLLMCENGGTQEPNYCKCQCPSGYNGTKCENKSEPCQNGACRDGEGIYTCFCKMCYELRTLP